jgi:glycosyltransferase involved in cell wall biosynthesis
MINSYQELANDEIKKLIYPTVSVIIPAFNEEETLSNVIEQASTVLDDFGYPFEIIVVDDGSTDKTGLVAASCKARVFANEHNRGKGYSLRKALQYATGEIVVTIDSDGEHNPKEIPSLISHVVSGADIAAGSRFIGRDKSYVTSRINKLGNSLFNLAIMMLTGNRITDSQTGFRAAKKDVLSQLDLASDGYEIESEITIKCLLGGFLLRELPISVQPRKFSQSKLRILSDGAKILSTIFKCSLYRIKK